MSANMLATFADMDPASADMILTSANMNTRSAAIAFGVTDMEMKSNDRVAMFYDMVTDLYAFTVKPCDILG